MESDWRFNVWLIGYDHSYFDLVARTVADPHTLICADERFRDAYFVFRQTIPGSEFPFFDHAVFLPGPQPFPFGVNVLPDH